MRFFIYLSYKGTNYHGWQEQLNACTVQGVLNKALSVILKKSICVTGAGRTDTGVHARYFVAHFENDASQMPQKRDQLVYQLNGILPWDISVSSIKVVTDSAHARYSAISRSYEYTITQVKDPFLRDFAMYFPKKPDIFRMNHFCRHLEGRRDFSCFTKAHSNVSNFTCCIHSAYWVQRENSLVFCITADRFLRNMVRAIVGTLLQAGLEKLDEQEFLEVLASGNRSRAGSSVPACGLALVSIEYPNDIFDETEIFSI